MPRAIKAIFAVPPQMRLTTPLWERSFSILDIPHGIFFEKSRFSKTGEFFWQYREKFPPPKFYPLAIQIFTPFPIGGSSDSP